MKHFQTGFWFPVKPQGRSSHGFAPTAARSCALHSLNQGEPELHSHLQRRYIIMATNRTPRYSADDVLRLPIPPHLSGYELVDGGLQPVTPVGLRHGRIATRLATRLDAHVRTQRIAGAVYIAAGFVLGLRRDPERLRGPDVSFLSQTTLDRAGGESAGFFRGAPDLAVEIESAERPKPMQVRIQDYRGQRGGRAGAANPTFGDIPFAGVGFSLLDQVNPVCFDDFPSRVADLPCQVR
jgi:Uma2 family endonuclease